jgi:peptidoglycan hydrolase CwlO-like protein
LVGQYQRDIAKLQQQLSDLQQSQPDPAAILNRLRKERKKSKADLKDVELIIELLQAIAL